MSEVDINLERVKGACGILAAFGWLNRVVIGGTIDKLWMLELK